MHLLGNAVVFVGLYIVFMLPTYFLPYVGSNSSLINAAGVAAEQGLLPAFWLHLGALLVLVTVTWFRGVLVEKPWLVILPLLAAVFDLAPGLSSIPMVPTVLHLLVLILGVASAKAAVPNTSRT